MLCLQRHRCVAALFGACCKPIMSCTNLLSVVAAGMQLQPRVRRRHVHVVRFSADANPAQNRQAKSLGHGNYRLVFLRRRMHERGIRELEFLLVVDASDDCRCVCKSSLPVEGKTRETRVRTSCRNAVCSIHETESAAHAHSAQCLEETQRR